MRHGCLIGMMIVILMAQAHAQLSATSYTLPRFESLRKAEVVQTIDGDTIELRIDGKHEKCRLEGIDTPELKGGAEETFYGREAAWFTFNALSGETVWYEINPRMRHDVYGRLLVYVYRAPDGMFVNLELVRLGYARVYEYEHAQAGLFKQYEARAKEAKKGLWNPLQRSQAAKPAASATPITGAVKAESAGGKQEGSSAIATSAQSSGSDAGTVYVTKSGKKYHRAGCRSLSKSSIPISVSAAKARGMQPCSVCKPGE